MNQWLIGSDLDGTLIYAQNTYEVQQSIRFFNVVLGKREKKQMLVYVTGRHFELARKGVIESGLIEPDYYICDVGTSVYRNVQGSFIQDETYRAQLALQWGDYTHDVHGTWLQSISGVTLQAEENQGEFKRSYYVSLGESLDNLQKSIRAHEAEGLGFNVTYSIDPNNDVGYLDILPKGVSKASALQYVAQQLSVSTEHIVFAGDSGNDLSVCRAGIKFIAPKNVGRDVEEFLVSDESRGYSTYRATQPYALGVLEGLRYFRVFS